MSALPIVGTQKSGTSIRVNGDPASKEAVSATFGKDILDLPSVNFAPLAAQRRLAHTNTRADPTTSVPSFVPTSRQSSGISADPSGIESVLVSIYE